MVAPSIADRHTTLTTSQSPHVLAADQQVRLAQVPSVIRQAISHLFACSGTDYSRIFEHLLRYATITQQLQGEQGKVAVIHISNQWQLYKSDAGWPCCYATLNTFMRILCALGILRKLPGRKEQASQYLLPLTNFVFHADAYIALERLIDPLQTKNPKVRRLAEKVRCRFTLFCPTRSPSMPVQKERVDSVLQTALTEMQHLVLHLTPGMDSGKKQQLMSHISTIMVQLYTARKVQDDSFSARVDSLAALSVSQEPVTATWQTLESATGDFGKMRVDSPDSSLAKEKSKIGASAVLLDSQQTFMLEAQANASTLDTCVQVHPGGFTDQNLPRSCANKRSQGVWGQSCSQHLPRDGSPVDSDRLNDNARKHAITNLFAAKHSAIDATAATTSVATQQQAAYRPLAAGAAQQLARFIEGHAGNFRCYIALSTRYHPQVLRAAILNMLAHSFFPDLAGELPGEVDGEITGKVGRPKKPGAWVTACCQAYAEHGIPPVMHLLLQQYSGPYSVVQQQLEARSRELSPLQFWLFWQEQLLAQQSKQALLEQAEQQAALVPELTGTQSMEEQGQTIHAGMSSIETQQLVAQINREGCTYHIRAHPCLQDGRWQVAVQIPFEEGPLTYPFSSKSAWETYFHAIRELHSRGDRLPWAASRKQAKHASTIR
ncbi:MAG: hypothetical protein NVSMB27_13850 [Ktedonobacteraceae bacterium]